MCNTERMCIVSDGVRRAEAGIGHNLEWPEAAVVQLARRVAGPDVRGAQPHVVAREDGQSGESLLIGIGGISFLGTAHICSQEFVDLAKRPRRRMCPLTMADGVRSHCQFGYRP